MTDNLFISVDKDLEADSSVSTP
eukprot:g11825.t1